MFCSVPAWVYLQQESDTGVGEDDIDPIEETEKDEEQLEEIDDC